MANPGDGAKAGAIPQICKKKKGHKKMAAEVAIPQICKKKKRS